MKCWSSTTARPTAPARRRRTPARASCAIPTTRATAPSVKTAIRAATSDWIAIVDADGQHSHRGRACGSSSRLGEFDLVIGARDPRTQATPGRRLGNAVLNWLASYLTERPIPGPDVRLPGGAARVPARVHPPAAERFFDADHHDAGVHQGRLQCRVRADCRAPRVGTSKIRLASDGAKFLSDLAESHHHLQPAAHLRARQRASPSRVGAGYGAWNFVYHARIPNGAVLLLMFSVIVHAGRPGLGADLDAAVRRAAP